MTYQPLRRPATVRIPQQPRRDSGETARTFGEVVGERQGLAYTEARSTRDDRLEREAQAQAAADLLIEEHLEYQLWDLPVPDLGPMPVWPDFEDPQDDEVLEEVAADSSPRFIDCPLIATRMVPIAGGFDPNKHSGLVPEFYAPTMLDRALALLPLAQKHGMKLVPLGADKDPASTLGVGWPQKARKADSSIEQITEWWTRWPEAGIGWILGPDMVVIDIDDKVTSDGKVKQGWKRFKAWLRERQLKPTWVARSASGGLHLYFKTDNADELKMWKVVLDGVDQDWDVRHGGLKGGMIVAPGTQTDKGDYHWLIAPSGFLSHSTRHHADLQEIQEDLRALLPKKAPEDYLAESKSLGSLSAELPADPYEVLRSGAGGCGDISRDIWNAVTMMKNLDVEESTIELHLTSQDAVYAHRYLTKKGSLLTRTRATLRAHAAWYQPLEGAHAAISREVAEVTAYYRAGRQEKLLSNSGNVGLTDWVVMDELIRIANACNKAKLFCSVRSLAAATHLYYKTVGAALQRLRASHWLKMRDIEGRPLESGGVGARVYQLQVPNQLRQQLTQLSEEAPTSNYSGNEWWVVSRTVEVAPLRRRAGDYTEAFARGALGLACQRVFEVLLVDAQRPAELVKTLSLSRSTVMKSLKDLTDLGLLSKHKGLYTLTKDRAQCEQELLIWSQEFGRSSALESRRKREEAISRAWAKEGLNGAQNAEQERQEDASKLLVLCDEYSVSEMDARVVKGRRYLRVEGAWENIDTGYRSSLDPMLRGYSKKKQEQLGGGSAPVEERRSRRVDE